MRVRLIVGSLSLLGAALPSAQAACTFSPGAGNDTYVCDSGSAPSLVDTEGDNRLVFPAGGTGAIEGDVTFGPGRDSIDMASGTIAGNVNQGGGIDDFVMSGGVISAGKSMPGRATTLRCSPGLIRKR